MVPRLTRERHPGSEGGGRATMIYRETVGTANRKRFVALAVSSGDRAAVTDSFSGSGASWPLTPPTAPGTVVAVRIDGENAVAEQMLAAPHSARARLYQLLFEYGIDPVHPPDAMREVEELTRASGIDDPSLVDLEALPFVTVDGPGTRDLDQALHIEACRQGYRVRYALADAAWFVRPGTALMREALARGTSYYLPGLAVPMLPRALSEGLISLNPGVQRRAMVFETIVDPKGQPLQTKIERARIRSRAQLTFGAVQDLLDGSPGHGIEDPGVIASLELLRVVGELRIADTARRNVIPHRIAEIRVTIAPGNALEFVTMEENRNAVERYSEQLSLLCNIEGAALLQARSNGDNHPIYRTHAPPRSAGLDELAQMTAVIAQDRNLDDRWRWNRNERSLADFLRGLPDDPQTASVATALARQAIMVNVRSTFTDEPGPHFGIGADAYARFSAPMREVVGIFIHKEAWELLGVEQPQPNHDDERLRNEIIARANRSKELQRELTRRANLLVLDQVFAEDLARPQPRRKIRAATVMGLRSGKIYLRLDAPTVDVKIYLARVDPSAEIDRLGTKVVRGTALVCRLGDTVHTRLRERSPDGHWLLELVDQDPAVEMDAATTEG